MDEACFTQVDNFIAELWERGDHNLWSLDCLVYTGAVCICRKVFKPKEKNKSSETTLLVTRSVEVTQLRRKIGWLTSECVRRRKNIKPTGRQSKNMRTLRKIFGRQNLRELEAQLEIGKCSLRIRAQQLRRLRKTLRRRHLNCRYRSQGPIGYYSGVNLELTAELCLPPIKSLSIGVVW